ncbi:hypothetical protein ACR8AL_09240 [Clavibacter sepedonicus]|uniref:Membrane protein n=1 Tax=Clavibacter sepedonicus TaxID=31964 RepID=B0RJ44_CLASE|nr:MULTISPECIES: hypothetical protein [Clavibacter]MBD5382699.1 hypothetical protein [Clavibacter sp.]OQJ45069.1 hypothetical protein B5P19_15890 [Clavibacter sepedonicus]OQJ50907.1 hypothetical protein B5P20_15860 [Clavibacter sepedonicus]UUK67294.1 hypothetical protein LRE50_16170 [Clavibacter sepedonicus]CAQ03234.1 putative membrane protein [Clavibacter sepedonicus]
MIYAAVLLAPLASAAVAIHWIRSRTAVGIVGGVLLLLFAIVVGALATAYVALQEAGGLRIPM